MLGTGDAAGQGQNLVSVVLFLAEHNCEDIRDHVYGVLGVVQNGDAFDVDYSLGPEQLLFRSLEFLQATGEESLPSSLAHIKSLAVGLRLDLSILLAHLRLHPQVDSPRYTLVLAMQSNFLPTSRERAGTLSGEYTVDNAADEHDSFTRHLLANVRYCSAGCRYRELRYLGEGIVFQFGIRVHKAPGISTRDRLSLLVDSKHGIRLARAKSSESIDEILKAVKAEQVDQNWRSAGTITFKPLPYSLEEDLSATALLSKLDMGSISQGLSQTVDVLCSLLSLVEILAEEQKDPV